VGPAPAPGRRWRRFRFRPPPQRCPRPPRPPATATRAWRGMPPGRAPRLSATAAGQQVLLRLNREILETLCTEGTVAAKASRRKCDRFQRTSAAPRMRYWRQGKISQPPAGTQTAGTTLAEIWNTSTENKRDETGHGIGPRRRSCRRLSSDDFRANGHGHGRGHGHEEHHDDN
jgi:hypothetical protein